LKNTQNKKRAILILSGIITALFNGYSDYMVGILFLDAKKYFSNEGQRVKLCREVT
jgi:hypothetical protein